MRTAHASTSVGEKSGCRPGLGSFLPLPHNLPGRGSSVADTALSRSGSQSPHTPPSQARIPVDPRRSSSRLTFLFPTNPHSTLQPDAPSSHAFTVRHLLLNPWGRCPSAQAEHFGCARRRQGLGHRAVASGLHCLAPLRHHFCPVSLPEAELHHAL